MSIRMPALRERLEDVPQLVEFLSKTLAVELGVPPVSFSREDMQRLQAYHWPGNVRELRNLIERALLLGRLPWETLSEESMAEAGTQSPVVSGRGFPPDWTLEQVEKNHMLRVLETTGGNKSEAARRLGVSRKTLERKLRSWSDTAENVDHGV